MTSETQSVRALYEQARCRGEASLFSSTSREAFTIASTRCGNCPVLDTCYTHVKPEDGYTGTVAGRLFYDGLDVTDDPSALPPPIFSATDVDPDLAAEVKDAFIAEDADWCIYNESTLMAAMWLLRKNGFRTSRISRVSGLTRFRVQQLASYFEEEAPADLKDFLLSFED